MDYSLGLYEKAMDQSLDWKAKMQMAGTAGFDFIEMSIDETDEKLSRLDMSKDKRLELLILMNETQVPIRTMCLSGHRRFPLGSSHQEVADRGLEIMEKAIGLAEDLGIRVIQLAGYDVYYEQSTPQTRQIFEKNLRRAVALAEKAGVLLAFETMETDFMNTVEKAMYYVRKMNSVYLKAYPDSGNITNAVALHGGDVCKDVFLGNGSLAALHLKESLPGKFREIPFGDGHVDFERIIQAAWSCGVRKYVAEFWHTPGDGPDTLKKVNDRFRAIFERQLLAEGNTMKG